MKAPIKSKTMKNNRKPKPLLLNGLEIALAIFLALIIFGIIVVIVLISIQFDNNLINSLFACISTLVIGAFSILISVLSLKTEQRKLEASKGICEIKFINSKIKGYFGIKISNIGISSPFQIASISFGEVKNNFFKEEFVIKDKEFRTRLLNISDIKDELLYTSSFENRYIGASSHIWLFKIDEPNDETHKESYENAKNKVLNYFMEQKHGYIHIWYRPYIDDLEYEEELTSKLIIFDE